MNDNGPRSQVPPRREQLIDQYTLAHQAAVEEKQAASRFEGFAETATDRKDYRAAADQWEAACRATSNALRHRRAELDMRKQEYSLYNHLDDEEKLYGLRLLIGYSERRLERLRTDSYKATVKSRIAHLRGRGMEARWDVKMMEQQIIKEDLHNRSKGYGGRDGPGRQAPHLSHVHLNDAGQKLRWLQGRIRWNLRALDERDNEIQQNEDEWERLREKEREREPEWRRLDDEARRYWSGDRTAQPSAQSSRQAQEDEQARLDAEFNAEAAKIQQEVEANAKVEAEAMQIQQMEDAIMDQENDVGQMWEDEYGAALEEDPDFTAGTKQYSLLKLDDKEAAPQSGDNFDDLAASLLADDNEPSGSGALFGKADSDSGSDNDASGSAEGSAENVETQVPQTVEV